MAIGDYAQARFRYYEWQPLHLEEKPYEILIDVPQTSDDSRRSNLSFAESTKDETVTDVRGFEEDFHLDVQGFSFHKCPTLTTDWSNPRTIEETYIPEMEAWVRRNVSGVDRIFTYDWRMRDSESKFPRVMNLKDPMDTMKPATQPHIDCTVRGAETVVKFHLQDEAEKLLKKRYRVINLWRPLHKVQNWPLAVCDARSVQDSNLVAVDRVRREFIGEGWYAKQTPDLKWYYLSDQDTDEVVLLKITDSGQDVARYCVHTSMPLGEDLKNVPRTSVEMRMLIFTDD